MKLNRFLEEVLSKYFYYNFKKYVWVSSYHILQEETFKKYITDNTPASRIFLFLSIQQLKSISKLIYLINKNIYMNLLTALKEPS